MGKMLLQVLSEAEVEKMHEKTLEVFETVGIKVTHAEALAKAKKAGAKVDQVSGTVRFPAPLVNELLGQGPSVIYESGLNGEVMEAGGNNKYYMSLILDPYVVDYEKGLRHPVLEDIRRHTIIGESLKRVNAMMRMQYPVSDVPEPDCYYKTIEVFLCHHTKHTAVYPTSVENCRDWMDVMEVIADASGAGADSHPLMSVAMAVTSPLQISGSNIEIMKMAMEKDCPVISTVCPMAGTTAPYSVAGTALISNVEALAAVLITQLYKPGHPVFYSVGPSVTDMKSGHDLYYRTEKMLFKIIGCQMGKYYNLPVSGEAGGTLTHRADVQNGGESALYLLSSLATGQNIIGGLGSLYNANGMSAEQIIMQCGLADMSEYLERGVDMSDFKLGVDSIRDVGPGGNYLTDKLTLDLLRADEFFESAYMDLTGGYLDNSPCMYEIAHRKAEELVNSYKPTVPEKIRAAIKKFFEKKYQSSSVAEL
ncbi:MAG: trimethylamine methyltransferase family protein [Sedimentisphaerales bacterium]|nr:trimethylamine methyltransferase family protein [Sedimentisphaerales bacterium]